VDHCDDGVAVLVGDLDLESVVRDLLRHHINTQVEPIPE
jgi:hypothetical protein